MGGEKHAQVTTMGSRPSDKYDEQNRQVQQEIHDSLILDLQDKERAIQQGNNVGQCMHGHCKTSCGQYQNGLFHEPQLMIAQGLSQKTPGKLINFSCIGHSKLYPSLCFQ